MTRVADTETLRAWGAPLDIYGASTLNQDEVRGMYYRGEIDRETLWYWEDEWANTLGADLPLSGLATARQLALQTGKCLWTFVEEQTLGFGRLQALAAERKTQYAEYLAQAATRELHLTDQDFHLTPFESF